MSLPSTLIAALDALLPDSASGSLCVAFSGGLDSTVLLHALAMGVHGHPRYRLRAVHIDHQLHADSARWQAHCAEVTDRLGVPCSLEQVEVPCIAQGGTEAAARKVRYEALRALLRPGEALLTAHHADDQLETVLLALMRGAGLGGLSAMPAVRRFGAGWHVRPMLSLTRAEMESWARAKGLAWVDDPSNLEVRFERNYLRRTVVPLLVRQWPAAARTATRSAAHAAEAAELIEELAAADLSSAAAGPCLRVAALAALPPARRRNLLRAWVKLCGARPPSTRKLAALEHDMLAAREDRNPCVAWDGYEVRRHRGLLYCEPMLPGSAASIELEWRWTAPLTLPHGMGRLVAVRDADGGLAADKLPEKLRVTFRTGGEWLQPAGHAHHRKLKKLLQSADVLPWWRGRVPLIHAGDALAAVGDLWVAREFAATKGAASVRIVWEDKPRIEAVCGANDNAKDDAADGAPDDVMD